MRPTRTAALAATLLIAAGVTAGHVSAQPSSEEPAPPTDPTAAAAPPGPKTTIDADGTYAVGTDIVPGNYTSAGPNPDGRACYWKRMNGDGLVDNSLTKKPAVVQISAGDTAFTTNDCQPWQMTNAPLPPQGSATEILGQLGKLILTNPSGPPPQSAQAPAAQAPAAEAPETEAPTEHLVPSGAAPGP
ncbi:MAG: hypothetical protein ACXWZR_05680 [Mycobacterium sp.]